MAKIEAEGKARERTKHEPPAGCIWRKGFPYRPKLYRVTVDMTVTWYRSGDVVIPDVLSES